MMEGTWAVDLSSVAFWAALGQIIWINAILSGDNAVVIALACRGLPERQRRLGMIFGAGAAIGLRIIFTIVVALLIKVPYLKIIGALLLLWIAIDLILPKDHGEKSVSAGDTLFKAITTIAIADVVMSLDNVLAIVGVAGDNWTLIILGLLISIPMIIAGSAILLAAIDRFPIIVWAGAALLGFVAGEMLISDVAVTQAWGDQFAEDWKVALGIGFAAAVVVVGWLIVRAKREKHIEEGTH